MTVPGYRISLGDNENILDSDSVVMVAHSHECTENRYIIPFKRMNYGDVNSVSILKIKDLKKK